jgi:hypothetical protein
MNSLRSKNHKRPFGVYVLIAVLVLLALDGAVDILRISRGEPAQTLPDLSAGIERIVFVALVAFFFILSIGLWRLHSWAWFTAMITGGLTLFYCIWHSTNGGSPYITMLLVIVMVLYLNLTEVKAAFHLKSAEERI